MSAAGAPLRVAIVGVGPKGLFALERLLARHRPDGAPLEIELFDPADAPGAGPNYALDLPDYLRMNFAAEQIDMWPADQGGAPSPVSFSEWRRSRPGAGEGSYPSRATVGRYLNQGFMRLVKAASRTVGIVHRRARVDSVARDGRGWILNPVVDQRFDEVLLTVGHASTDERSLAAGDWSHPVPLIPSVFPVDRMLSEAAVPAGSVVAIRGFALTMIDAALALTEGRGGRFAGDDPLRVRYEPSRMCPDAIVPFSRSGRPMLAKTDPVWAADRGVAQVGVEASARIRALAGPVDIARDVAPQLAAVATAALERLGCPAAEAEINDWLAAAVAGPAPGTLTDPEAELERSIGVAAGAVEPGVEWALGHAWRVVYPAVVARFGEGGLAPEHWGTFRRLAAEMERIAFGPPPVNAAKLLALSRAGAVDLSHTRSTLCSDGEATVLRSERGAVNVDAVIDAVLPGPGAVALHQPPVDQLIGDGLARVAPNRRGLELTPDATCVGASGSPSVGLAAIGRPTEDWVIGNDTLSRSLHDWPDRWARRVISRAGTR